MRRVLVIFILIIMNGCIQNDKSKLTICCAGDSLMRPMPIHLKKILKASKRKIVIKDWSQGGLSSRSYQSFFRRHYSQWRKTRPDFILIQLGTNDVLPLLNNKYNLTNFEENLYLIIRNFKKFKGNKYRHAKIFVASVPFIYRESNSEEENRIVLEGINPTIEEVARKEKIDFVDNSSVLDDRVYLYSSDGVHPNYRGERALARNWLFWIRNELRKNY